MTEFPRVVYCEKNTEDNAESNATKVDNILQEIYDLKGEQLNYLTQFEFEDLLRKLMQYVTLIGFEIRPKVYKTKHKSDDEKLLVYYYDEVFIHILKLQLMVDNGFDYTLVDLLTYKVRSVNDKKCVVYDIDDRYGESVFEINYELSNLDYIIPEDLTVSIDY